jgi:hypothetical protein
LLEIGKADTFASALVETVSDVSTDEDILPISLLLAVDNAVPMQQVNAAL